MIGRIEPGPARRAPGVHSFCTSASICRKVARKTFPISNNKKMIPAVTDVDTKRETGPIKWAKGIGKDSFESKEPRTSAHDINKLIQAKIADTIAANRRNP